MADARFIDPPITTIPEHTLHDQQNNARTINDGGNALLLVNFWATWCAPCVHELPTLAAFSQHYADQPVRLVLVNEDLQFAKGVDFLKQFDFHDKTTHLFDQGGQFLHRIKGRGLPVTLLVTPEGEIIRYAQGDRDWNTPEIHTLIAEHVPAPKGALQQWWDNLFQ